MYHYLLGNYRYWLISKPILKLLVRKHIREQSYYRVKVMDVECLINGACIKCGCATPNLQMANKSCEGNCYPPMMSKKEWYTFKIDLKKIENEKHSSRKH